MPTIPSKATVGEHSSRYGVIVILAGVALLVGLRLWTSPLTRRAAGGGEAGLLEFLMIPGFLGVVAIGIALFLWEPDGE